MTICWTADIQEFGGIFLKFEAQYFRKNLVTETDVVLFPSMDGTVKFALKKSGGELLGKYSKSVKTMQSCEECVKNTGHVLNAIKEEVFTRYTSFCENFWSNGIVCEACSEVGRKYKSWGILDNTNFIHVISNNIIP